MSHESNWVDGDVNSVEGALNHFTSSLSGLVKSFMKRHNLPSGFCAVTGIEVAAFSTIMSFGDMSHDTEKETVDRLSKWIRQSGELPKIQRFDDFYFLPIIAPANSSDLSPPGEN